MPGKQHFVSQFHLRHFLAPDSVSEQDPWLWVGDFATEKVKRRAPKNMAWLRGMFDGPGGFADAEASLEKYLASEIESAAAHALAMFCKMPQGTRQNLPPALMRYIAWAAARSLPMISLFQQWADEHEPHKSNAVVEPPPQGWEKISDRPRLHCLKHSELGIKDNVPTAEVSTLLKFGWKLNFNRDDLLELIHMQAWYFQARFFPRLDWLVLEAPEGKSFVIGDRPVVWGFQGYLTAKPCMLRHPAVQLFAPLSRSVALLAHPVTGSPLDSITPEQFNSVMVSAATQWIAGSDESTVLDAMNSAPLA